MVNGGGGSLPEKKWPGNEASNGPLSSEEVENKWSYTSIPLIYIHEAYEDILNSLLNNFKIYTKIKRCT